VFGDTARPETDIFIENLLKDFMERKRGIKPTVVLYPDYNFIEADIGRIIGEVGGDIGTREVRNHGMIIALPMVVYGCPTHWPMLVHEMGHVMEESYGVVKRIKEEVDELDLDSRDSLQKVTSDWMKEITADLISLRILGPAYLASFVSFSLLKDDLMRHVPSHPSTKTRFDILADKFGDMGIKSEVVNFYIDRFNERFDLFPRGLFGLEIRDEDRIYYELDQHLPISLNIPFAFSNITEKHRDGWGFA
jgi:hypothetical protein